MDQENNQRVNRQNYLKAAIDHPHLLVLGGEGLYEIKAIAGGCAINWNEPGKLQYFLAKYGDEESLQGLIDFFTEAHERHRVIKEDEKAEIIPLNDKPE